MQDTLKILESAADIQWPGSVFANTDIIAAFRLDQFLRRDDKKTLEQRRYRACYIVDDEQVGLGSDETVVTCQP